MEESIFTDEDIDFILKRGTAKTTDLAETIKKGGNGRFVGLSLGRWHIQKVSTTVTRRLAALRSKFMGVKLWTRKRHKQFMKRLNKHMEAREELIRIETKRMKENRAKGGKAKKCKAPLIKK